MKKLLLSVSAIALALALSTSAFAVGTVSSVLNGTIQVGTYLTAVPGQYGSQTSVGSVTGFTTVNPGSSAYEGHAAINPLVTTSITGATSSTNSGTGTFGTAWINPAYNAFVGANITTTITNFTIPVSTLVIGNGGHSQD